MDEQSELNLYLFAGNSPINIVDRLGWYTYNNAKSILRREKNWPSLADELWNLRIDCSMQQRFNEWIAREQDDLKWLDSIPDCPDKICVVDGKPKDCDNGLWDKFTEADQQYHKGAKWCMRSSTFFGPSQQCCYDGKGDLITDAHSGAGTPDRYAPTIINLLYLLHYIHDVDPYFVALDLDDKKTGINFDAYIGVRPPSQGGGSCYK